MDKNITHLLEEVNSILEQYNQQAAILILSPREYQKLKKILSLNIDYHIDSGPGGREFVQFGGRKIFLIKRMEKA